MSAVIRSAERLSAVPTDRPEAGTNQRRVEEAFRLLGMAAARIVSDPNPSSFVIDLAGDDGALQAVWCRDEFATETISSPPPIDASEITIGTFGPINAERYVRAQKALSTLLLELARPDGFGSASLRLRGVAGQIDEDIRGDYRRQYRF
jgi:hypothetical protein